MVIAVWPPIQCKYSISRGLREIRRRVERYIKGRVSRLRQVSAVRFFLPARLLGCSRARSRARKRPASDSWRASCTYSRIVRVCARVVCRVYQTYTHTSRVHAIVPSRTERASSFARSRSFVARPCVRASLRSRGGSVGGVRAPRASHAQGPFLLTVPLFPSLGLLRGLRVNSPAFHGDRGERSEESAGSKSARLKGTDLWAVSVPCVRRAPLCGSRRETYVRGDASSTMSDASHRAASWFAIHRSSFLTGWSFARQSGRPFPKTVG